MPDEIQPWWFAPLAPIAWWLINAAVRLLGAYLQGRADELAASGEPWRAHTWTAMAAVASNLQVGRRPSSRPPPYSALLTLPPPARVPADFGPLVSGPLAGSTGPLPGVSVPPPAPWRGRPPSRPPSGKGPP
jgi:hypothetical protein